MEKHIVEARVERSDEKTSRVVYVPMLITFQQEYSNYQALAYDGDDVRTFDTFDAAAYVCALHEHGPIDIDDVDEMTWDYQTTEWHVTYRTGYRRAFEREDFHGDL